ncbi:MAG: hypothetical protein U5N58_13690 [Actinomycetota bacterium]|nr:hypothetical protein [Actinomycetota bacterium]
MELAYFTPTLSVYGTRAKDLTTIIKRIRAPYYITETTPDVCGVEICSAFKNVYAMGLGICDGLYADKKPGAYHNLSSLIFGQGVKEMALIVEAGGGKECTAYGPAG